jgi:hypothetical protein
MTVLVPISYFFGAPRSEIWRINTSDLTQELWLTLPESNRAVKGKGITGLQRINNKTLVACDFNRVFTLNNNGNIISYYQPDDANDFHQLSVSEGLIYVANTGRDSIDVLSLELELVKRYDGLLPSEWKARKECNYSIDSDYYDSIQLGIPFHKRRVPDKWHFNHVIKLSDSFGGNILATSFSEKRLINISNLEPVSTTFNHQPHDGFIYQNKMWMTTVSGEIYAAELQPSLEFKRVLDLFSFLPYQGWCRGLIFAGGKLLIGITAIYENNNRSKWLTTSIENTRTGIYQLNSETFELEHFFDFSCNEGSRVFSMLEDDTDSIYHNDKMESYCD